MPNAAIFADTQDEPASVYRWLDWLEGQLPFPVHRVTRGKLSAHSLKMKVSKKGRRFSATDIPFFTRNVDGSQGKITNRGCTRDFKLQPIFKLARLIGEVPRKTKATQGNKYVTQLIGISLDEVYRMRTPRDWWAVNSYPLIDRKMTRHDCLLWMQKRGFPTPPRSACRYCPFHSNSEWRRLSDEEPDEFALAVQFERDLQAAKRNSDNFGFTPFLHRSLRPLDEVDLSTDDERGQGLLWNNECEGMCGI